MGLLGIKRWKNPMPSPDVMSNALHANFVNESRNTLDAGATISYNSNSLASKID